MEGGRGRSRDHEAVRNRPGQLMGGTGDILCGSCHCERSISVRGFNGCGTESRRLKRRRRNQRGKDAGFDLEERARCRDSDLGQSPGHVLGGFLID